MTHSKPNVLFIGTAPLNFARAFKRLVEHRKNAKRATVDVFSAIYAHNKWGGPRGVFYSGTGSHDSAVVDAYVRSIREWLGEMPYESRDVVDLGCGDFHIGRQIVDLCRTYSGVDIVPELIEHNRAIYADEHVNFVRLDIASEQLPDGQICILREVLQHLSNAQILAILPKLERYTHILVTDIQPSQSSFRRPNIDKVQGADLRLFWGSGVFLHESPFSIPIDELSTLLEIDGPPRGPGLDNGVLRTVIYTPRGNVDGGVT